MLRFSSADISIYPAEINSFLYMGKYEQKIAF